MNMTKKLSAAMTICICFFIASFAQDDIKPWEKYGLSQTEWKVIQENGIPRSKVEQILKSGISVTEYVEKPWVKFNLSEKTYIDKRRSGLSAYDIELERTSDRSGWKKDNRGALKSEKTGLLRSKELLVSFVLPGFQQRKLNHTWRSRIMGALAIGSVAGSIYLSAADGKPEFTPLFVILAPDMFWSMIDFKFSRKNADGQ
jgi:hypothetical protein